MSSISSSAVGTWDSIQNIPKRLYTVLLMKSFLTTLYSTLRIYLIGDLPDASGVNIASQAMWLNLLFEILQEGLIRPLYNSIGSTVNDLDETLNKLKTGFLLVAGVFSVFSIPLWIFTRQIIELMSANAVSVDFIRLELISNILISLNMFLEIILQLKFSNKILLLGLFTRLIFTIIFDIFFLSQFSVSLKLGVNGVAYSNIGEYTTKHIQEVTTKMCEMKMISINTKHFSQNQSFSSLYLCNLIV
ncbi:uncharacterized protein LOC111715045 [Eurytemora carolleeae]|uniref:uncharacterized protein LOC111715045 n=1 Tax=Eurytemora carolleeae TaxID=1294199 RepID=UPI000C77A4F6|nr:uncharacterized protein LOC111715045 [Eurytemora carolleeae]|eukprot:XP_023346050.1 uncharacterized protein LOC111715045 [Eurytemora affinis]